MMRTAWIGAIVAAAMIATFPASAAAVVVTLEQVGTDVVLSGTGSLPNPLVIDLENIPDFAVNGAVDGLLGPSSGEFGLGTDSGGFSTYVDAIVSGPASFGSGSLTVSDASSGPFFLLAPLIGDVSITADPLFTGEPLTVGTSTFLNTTIADLGATPGPYVWTLDDRFGGATVTFEVSAAVVPLPAAGWLLLGGLGALGLVARRRRAER